MVDAGTPLERGVHAPMSVEGPVGGGWLGPLPHQSWVFCLPARWVP